MEPGVAQPLRANRAGSQNVPSNSDAITYRNTFAGPAGSWGTLLAGRHEAPMKRVTNKLNIVADMLANYRGAIVVQDQRLVDSTPYMMTGLAGDACAMTVEQGRLAG